MFRKDIGLDGVGYVDGGIGIEGWMVYYDFIPLCWRKCLTSVGRVPF